MNNFIKQLIVTNCLFRYKTRRFNNNTKQYEYFYRIGKLKLMDFDNVGDIFRLYIGTGSTTYCKRFYYGDIGTDELKPFLLEGYDYGLIEEGFALSLDELNNYVTKNSTYHKHANRYKLGLQKI